MRQLIVNADDCNLTAGVTQSILECHEKGIVSSTSWMVNLPASPEIVLQVAKSGLGVGVHLNVTSGKPVSNVEDIRSLINPEGAFKKKDEYLKTPPVPEELVREYDLQVALFKKQFGRAPTHLDTHHQVHDFPVFMQALAHVAREARLPIRRSLLMREADFMKKYPGLIAPQGLIGDLGVHSFWTTEKLERSLSELLPGTTEVMCHPGIWDAELQRMTSMTVTREKEYALFSSPHLKKVLERLSIRLINFSQIS